MKKVLIVVDMQKDFISGSLGTKEAKNIVSNVVSKINEYKINNDTIYFTKDTHFDYYLNTQEGKNLPIKHCIVNTDGWELEDSINQLVGDSKVVNKITFGSVVLAKELFNKYGNEDFQVELVGLCTDICVISNAMIIKAFLPDSQIIVDASCCAGVTPMSHKNALECMKMCQIKIINE